MKLVRTNKRSDGIFGELYTDDDKLICYTLEHAYQQSDGSWEPKVPVGNFQCVRGQHQLHGMTSPFETFEITGVTGHSDLLFHMGNFDKDSQGCLLLGEAVVNNMVTNSRATFAKFMDSLNGVNEFTLLILS